MSEEDRLVGTLVADRYRVERKLGEGGMGLVYLAVHEKLKKQVALKVLGTIARSQKEAIARFEREAVAAANLKHPNIAEATDFGQLPDGGLYLVMEYVEGTTLRKLLADHGKLPPERVLAILEQVAAALAAAHARDVVHRDLKPENIIVTGANDTVKVIDFGIAKVKNATFGSVGTGLTTAGTVFGTAQYMSPEQAMGQAVDARADQYALGVIAFEMLTGKRPFDNEDVSRLMMMHVGAPVPSTRESVPTLSPEIDAVTSKMLGKLPDERFASVTDAMDAFAKALEPRATAPVMPMPAPVMPAPVMPPPAPLPVRSFDSTLQSPRYEAPRNNRGMPGRHALVTGAVVTALLLLALALGLLVRSSSSSSDEDEVGTAPAGKSKGKGKGKKK